MKSFYAKRTLELVTLIIIYVILLADMATPQFMHWRKLGISHINHIVVSNSGNLFASSSWYRTIYKSTDNGIHWTSNYLGFEINALEPVRMDTLIFGDMYGKILFSFDGGTTFNLINNFSSKINTIRFVDFSIVL